MSIRRVYVNSYLAYENDSGESLTNFFANFPTAINNPKDVSIMNSSLLFYPKYPNFTPSESKVYMKAIIGATTYNIIITIPVFLVYSAPSDPNGIGFVNVQNELNNPSNIVSTPALPTDFSTDVGAFVYNTDDQNFNFIAVAGNTISFEDGTSNAYRRLGLQKQFLTQNIGGATLDFGNPPILARTQVIYICSNISNDSMINGKTGYGSNIMAQFPVLDPTFGSVINYIPTYDWGSLAFPRSFETLNITLLDDQFLPIEFSSNANLLIGFQITYDEEREEEMAGQLKNISISSSYI